MSVRSRIADSVPFAVVAVVALVMWRVLPLWALITLCLGALGLCLIVALLMRGRFTGI